MWAVWLCDNPCVDVWCNIDIISVILWQTISVLINSWNNCKLLTMLLKAVVIASLVDNVLAVDFR